MTQQLLIVRRYIALILLYKARICSIVHESIVLGADLLC